MSAYTVALDTWSRAATSAGVRNLPSEGRATGAPNGVVPYASGALACVRPDSATGGDSTGCFAVPPGVSPWKTAECPWGASGRWFKSSRPDSIRPRSSSRFATTPGPSSLSTCRPGKWCWVSRLLEAPSCRAVERSRAEARLNSVGAPVARLSARLHERRDGLTVPPWRQTSLPFDNPGGGVVLNRLLWHQQRRMRCRLLHWW